MLKTALATIPAVLLDQRADAIFKLRNIEPDETGVIGAITSSCVQLPKAPSSVVFSTVEFLALLINL